MITVRPLDASFGALIEGVDLTTAPDRATHDKILAALDEHLVVVFRGSEQPTNAQVVEFCRAFGPLRPTLADRSRLRDFPDVNLVANRNFDGVQGGGGSQALHFHSDLHHEPPLIEFIYLDALAVPDEGGDTLWVDLRRAYDDLGAERQAKLDGLTVRYQLRGDLDRGRYFKATDDGLSTRKQSSILSLVQTNSRTGRKSVYANTGPHSNHTAQVVGMAPRDSDELLTKLFEHCTHERYRARHHWRVGDAVLWHNLSTLHGRDGFPDAQVRMMRHINILGVADPHNPVGGR